MKHYIKRIFALGIVLLMSTSCFKRDDFEDVDIYTTVYPVQYVTDYLYGYNANVTSIYPAEVNPEEHELSKRHLEKYSKGKIFIYNGLSKEKSIARDLLNLNKDLNIIDVSKGLEYTHSVEELWMNPSDFLMLAHNIKNGLEEYIQNKYIIEEINKNYDDLKLMISSYDAELEMVPDHATDTNILIASDTLSFLSKYGFDIINIDESLENVPIATKNRAKKLIGDGVIKYVYMLDNQEETDTIKEMVEAGAEVKKLRSMTVLTEEDIANGTNYKNMIRDNIEEIKREVYELDN